MAKRTKNISKNHAANIDNAANNTKNTSNSKNEKTSGYAFAMSHAPRITEDTHWFQMLPIIVFGAIVIMITRMYNYSRPMDMFYWTSGNTSLSDFFSYYKMVLILICAALALLIIAYRFITQSMAIKKSFVYIPMAVYSLFVILSYVMSEYKLFALYGYNDRFEGTLPLLAYMVMLFLTINAINTERNVKWVVYSVSISSAMLGILGVTQALDHDFLRTPLGQKLISPNHMTNSGQTINQMIDEAAAKGEQLFNFTFKNQEIYQTVYNINYVSFYLTLLLPLVGLLFIRSVSLGKAEKVWKKIVWGALFALLIFNLIGSASSGGFFGMAIVVLLAFIVLNKKILIWWKPVAILLIITALVGGITADRWLPEIQGTFRGVTANTSAPAIDENGEIIKAHKVHYIDTDGRSIKISLDDTMFHIMLEDGDLKIFDEADTLLEMGLDADGYYHAVDERFYNCAFRPLNDENKQFYIEFTFDRHEQSWLFAYTKDRGFLYRTEIGNFVDLDPIPAFGFENNSRFGSGRGYIWSRTFPMMPETAFIGHGADTYCLYFPQNDYVGKYNSYNYSYNINIIVDKPHNMYMATWIGTGGISTIALLLLYGFYIVQSFNIYRRRSFEDMSFLDITGVGIFLGITGFVFTGLVDDSSVSVMPMFYALLGTGIAINMMNLRGTEAE